MTNILHLRKLLARELRFVCCAFGRMASACIRVVVIALFLSIGFSATGSSQNPSGNVDTPKALPADLPGSARFIRDEKGVTVIEFSGNYDRGLGEPRRTIAKEFLRTHADAYDFVVVYSSFEFPTIGSDGSNALAFYNSVKNDVGGIGVQQFDNSRAYGSLGTLQGYLDMAAVSRYAKFSSDARYEVMLSTFAHEVQHRWGSYVKFRDWSGATSSALLGRDASHWSYLLDTQGSVHYGARWRDNGDGSFTATETRSTYSPLDLYLMGLIDKSQVPPFTLIDAPTVDATQLPPFVGATVRGTRRVVTIDDIIAVEGERVPSASQSKKEFRFAFMYLVRPGETIDPTQLGIVAEARRQVGLRYNALTHGKGIANVFSEPARSLIPQLPASILPTPSSAPTTNAGNSPAGLSWLKTQQKADGSFMDAVGLAPRDTLLARSYLRAAEPSFSGLGLASSWIANRAVVNTDFLSRKLIESSAGERRDEDIAALLSIKNSDGGWGLGNGLRSNPLDTAMAIQALRAANVEATVTQTAIALLIGWQNSEGGWGGAVMSPSRVTTTAQVVNAIRGVSSGAPAINKAKDFLRGKQNTDGGFGDSPSSIHDTANVALALTQSGLATVVDLPAARRYIADKQRVDGSWQGSVYSTVLALSLLRSAAAANLAVSDFQVAPASIADGQRAELSVKVINRGALISQATTVQFFDGDPAAGGTLIAVAVPLAPLVSGDFAVAKVIWNTTGRVGGHALFAIVDYEQLTADLARSDNVASLPVTVSGASALPDLLISDGDISATPNVVSSLPALVQIDALVSNAGLSPASNVKAVLYTGLGAARSQVAEATFSISARSTAALQFKPTLSMVGTTVYTIEIDPAGAITEATQANNSASVIVKTVGGVSLSVTASDIAATPANPTPGADVVFAAKLRNVGTVDSTSFNVRYSIRAGSVTTQLATNVVQIAAGAVVEQRITWRPTQGGSYTFVVELDPEGTSGDTVISDNKASLDFTVGTVVGLNLATSFRDITFTPSPALEGYAVKLSALVRNVGDVTAPATDVGFYDGDPVSGGVLIGLTNIAALAAGASSVAEFSWAIIPTAAERLIFVVVDPLGKLSAEKLRDDNTAFERLRVLTLPDFAITRASLALNPTVPKPSDPTTLTVVVANLGQQSATNLVVSAFDGPESSGKRLAADMTIPTIAANGTANVQFAFVAPAAPGLNQITVVVNPQSAIKERVRDNNSVTFSVGIQDANFALSELFISPNGDGVKDGTTLTFRLPAAISVTVQVTDEKGRVLRKSAALAPAAFGAWTWDGLDDDGRLVQDGRYELLVRDAAGVVIGGATVEVDTNRSSLLAVIGKSAGVTAALSCAIPQPSQQVFSISGGSGFYVNVTPSNPLLDLPAGLYREDDWARGLKQVLPGIVPVGATDPTAWGQILYNGGGTRIVAYNPSQQTLIAAGGEGEGKKTIYTGAIDALLGLSESTSEAYLRVGSNIVAVNVDSAARRTLAVQNIYVYTLKTSPDVRKAVANSATGYLFIDLVVDQTKPLPMRDEYYWSPGGKYLVGRKTGVLSLFDASGNSVGEIPTEDQSGQEAWADDSSELYLPIVPGCSTPTSSFGVSRDCVATIRRVEVPSSRSANLTTITEKGDYYGTLKVDLQSIPGRYEILVKSAGQITNSNLPTFRVLDLRAPYSFSEVTFSSPPPPKLTGNSYSYGPSSDFVENGRGLQYAAAYNPLGLAACDSTGRSDNYVFRTLENLQTDLVLLRQSDGVSVRIRGGVADKHFAKYSIDYASDSAPTDWHPVVAPNPTAVWGKDLATWIPPGVGRFTVRLTAEDQAGNRREKTRRINIAVGPPITNVVREPEYFSPNGDGVKDEMKLSYRVLEPVNLDFNIYTSAGVLVRTIARSHPVADVDALILWDGRDDNGQTVVDGEYRIRVVGFDFFVTVDTTPPRVIELRSGAPFATCFNGKYDVHCRSTELRWNVSDINFERIQFEVGDGATPAKWRAYAVKTEQSVLANTLKENWVTLPIGDYVGQRYRITASDKAGNRTTQMFDVPQQSVRLLLADQILQDDLPLGATSPAPSTLLNINIPVGTKALNMRPAAGIALGFAESLVEPIVSVTVQYNESKLTDLGQWLEDTNVVVYPLVEAQFIPIGGRATSPTGSQVVAAEMDRSAIAVETSIPQNYGVVTLFNSNLNVESGLTMRLKLVGRSGTEYLTNSLSVVDGNGITIVVDGTVPTPVVSETVLVADIALKTAQVATKLEVFASSADDPFFLVERKISQTLLGSVVSRGFQISRDGRYVSCAIYNLRAVATLADGRTISDTAKVSSCGGARFQVRPDFADCGQSAPLRLRSIVTPLRKDAIPLISLEVFSQRADGTRELIFNVVNPQYQDYEFTFEHAAKTEGIVQFVGVVTDRDGVKRSNLINVPLDHTPASARITYPLENQRVCAVRESHPRVGVVNVLRPQVEIVDAAGFDYSLEYRVGDATNSWKEVLGELPSFWGRDPVLSNGMDSFRPREPYTLAEFLGRKSTGREDKLRPYMTGKRLAGNTGPLVNLVGNVSARLTTYDWSGSTSCREVNFYLDGDVEIEPASVDRRLFSPGTTSSLRAVLLQLVPLEAMNISVNVRRILPGGKLEPGVVRHLLANLAVLSGARDYEWDGKGDSGSYVVDGQYTFDVFYRDGCGNVKGLNPDRVGLEGTDIGLMVEVDRTAPALQIDRPASGDVTASFIDLVGKASDRNMLQWTIDYSVDSAPDSWVVLASKTQSIDLGKLAILNATDLQGIVTLRLKAVDKAELTSELTRQLRLKPRVKLIRTYSLVPTPFSPNADGKRDTLDIVFDLYSAAQIDLLVKRGTVVRRLLTQAPYAPGKNIVTWDGRDNQGGVAIDGEYTLDITATSLSDATNLQTESLTAMLDVTPPKVTLAPPLKPFMSGSASISGSITDQELVGFDVFVEGPSPTQKRVILASGSASVTNEVLGSLADLSLDDGTYRVRVIAKDAAENNTDFVSDVFEIDSKAPTVTLSNPAVGTFVSRVRPADIGARLADKNLSKYELKVGDVTLKAQEPVPSEVIVTSRFDGGALIDGEYKLVVTGVDKAGNIGSAASKLNVDNTPPRAEISSPAANTFVGGSLPVVGTASDSNIESWKLEIGSGIGAAVESLTVIAQGTSAVDNAKLSTLIGLPPDGPATLRLTVVDRAGNESVANLPLQIDATPPVAPVLAGAREQRNNVRLTWTATNDPSRITGYNLFRNGVKLNAQVIADFTYLDLALGDGSYSYAVTALAKSGLESAKSNTFETTIKVSGPQATISKPVANATVSGLVSIEGTAYAATDFKSYRVSVGSGIIPTMWTVLRNSPLPVQGDTLATWTTQNLVEGAIYSIRLEADDTLGNTSTTSFVVTIDNRAPAKPIGLRAVVSGTNDIAVSWTANVEPDLAGYLLYRDGQLVNQIDPTDNSIRPYLLVSNSYLDKNRPDGVFVYAVVAVDKADNQSERSDPVSVAVDTRPPRAVIVEPLAGAVVDGRVFVRAVTPDTDVASIAFQYRASSASAWTDIPGATSKVPYTVSWDAGSLTNGSYDLRAVATDLSGKTDPAPAIISVTRKNLQRPITPTALNARVDGGDVRLTWQASASADIRGYIVLRTDATGAVVRVNTVPVNATTYVDSGRPDMTYLYQVLAVNTDNNESAATTSVSAVVYTTQLKQPYTPVAMATTAVVGHTRAGSSVTLNMVPEIGAPTVLSTTPNPLGDFAADALPLALGVNLLSGVQTDPLGNRSKTSTVRIARGTPPASPQGVSTVAIAGALRTSWTASSEVDVVGYVTSIDDAYTPQAVTFNDVIATSSLGSYASPDRAIDAYDYTAWQPAATDAVPSIQVKTTSKQLLSDIDVIWNRYGSNSAPLSYIVEAWDGFVWVPLAENAANDAGSLRVTLSPPYLTDRIRLSVGTKSVDGYSSIQVSDVKARALKVVSGTTSDTATADGIHTGSVRALNALGLLSAPSTAAPTGVGDTTPPPAVVASVAVSGATATLTWTESVATDLAKYEILRDGVVQSDVAVGQPRVFVDGPLVNGTYRYTVRPVDAVGNKGQLSNEAIGVVSALLPGAPIQLQVTAPVGGSVLRLTWQIPINGGPTSSYVVRRATVAAGPYSVVGTTDFSVTQFSDATVSNGITYFYVVRSRDAAGNEGASSNEASGRAADTQAPSVPAIFYPTVPELPLSVTERYANVRAFAEPETTVSLFRDGATLTATTSLKSSRVANLASASYVVPAPHSDLTAFADYNSLRIVNLAPQLDGVVTATLVKTVSGLYLSAPPVWSPNAQTLAAPIYSGIKLVNAVTGAATNGPALSGIRDLAWHPDSTRLLAITGNGLTFEEVTLSTIVRRTIATSATNAFASIALSPDGSLAGLVSGNSLLIYNLSDGTATQVPGLLVSGRPVWSKDGRSIYFVGTPNYSTQRQAYRYQVAQTAAEVITTESADVLAVGVSPVGAVTYLTNSEIKAITPDGARTSLGLLSNNASTFVWSDGGLLLAASYQASTVIAVPGLAIFPSASLNAGQNLLAARSTDLAGNRSELSPAISVTYQQGAKPDLAIDAKDVTILPQVPVVGGPVRITVVVNNVGTADALPAALQVTAVSASGIRVALLSARTSTIAAGGSQVFRADGIFSTAGDWQIVVVADAADEIEELSESNNTVVLPVRVIAAATSARELTVTTDKSAYGVNDALAGMLTLFNGRADVAGRVSLQIEDAQGYLVAALPDLAVTTLAYGQSRSLTFGWSVPSLYDGAYSVRARWVDATGAFLTQTSTAFTVTSKVRVSSQIRSDRSQYAVGTPARIVAQVDPTGTSPTTASARAVTRILNPDGSLASEASDDVSLFSVAQMSKYFETAGRVTGRYVLELRVIVGGAEVSRSTSYFDVVPATVASVALVGDIALDRSTVKYSDRLTGTAILNNTGTSDFSNLSYEINIVDPQSGAVLARSAQVAPTLLHGAELRYTFDFPATGLPVRTLWVQLRTTATLSGVVSSPGVKAAAYATLLRQREASVFELDPPVVGVAQPTEGAYLRSAQSVLASASDLLSGVRSVESQIDGGAWGSMTLVDPVSGNYAGVLSALVDGIHRVAVRGTDNSGNVSDAVLRNFTIDSVTPVIAITGVASTAYQTAVSPMFSATDINLLTVSATLNGASFVSGTRVAQSGAYVLQVDALDRAGNLSSQVVRFTISVTASDTTPPVIVINSPAAGSYIRRGSNLLASIIDAESTIASADFVVDSNAALPLPLDSGDAYRAALDALADGAHSIIVHATDAVGNKATSLARPFVVDNTPPVIVITGVSAGQYMTPVTAVIGITDTWLDSSVVTLNGIAYASGSRIAVNGDYTLTVTASDRAGNVSTSTVRFSIQLPIPDTLAPNLTINQPTEGAYVRVGQKFFASASDGGSGVAAVEQRTDSQAAWKPLAAGAATGTYTLDVGSLSDGPHAVAARATDNAGNVSDVQTRRFIVDNTPPVIVFRNVANGGRYDGAVSAEFEVTDVDLVSSSANLNGLPYISGTAITTAGSYTLTVTGRDRAGNETANVIVFVVNAMASNAPVVVAVSPKAGAVVRSGSLFVAQLQTGSDIARLEVAAATGLPYVAMRPSANGTYDLPIPVAVDGIMTLRVRAVSNLAVAYADVTHTVTIDNTPPVIESTSVLDGKTYPVGTSVVFRMTDAHLATTTATLDGKPVISGDVVRVAGRHVLSFVAIDVAGNQSSLVVSFNAEAAPPVPIPVWPGNNPFFPLAFLAFAVAFLGARKISHE
jgi:large repetitive protein